MAVYYFVWVSIQSKKDDKKIWVLPKKPPALPFGPQPEPTKKEDYQATTYFEHESKLIKDAASQILMGCLIPLFMSWKYNIHMGIFIQAFMLPLGLFDSVVCMKYLGLNGTKEKIYDELLSDPMIEDSDKKDNKSEKKEAIKSNEGDMNKID